MRATVSRKALFSVISHGIGIIDKKPAIPVLSHLLLTFESEKITVKATDLDHSFSESISAQVETYGSVAINGQMLFDIIRKFSENTQLVMYLTDRGKKMVIESELSRFELQTIDASEYPSLDDFTATSSFSISPSELKSLIDVTKFAMAVEETRFNLNGLYIHTNDEKTSLISAATDGHRLAVSSCAVENCEISTGIYSRKTILELRKLLDEIDSPVVISTNANKVQFQAGNVTLTARLVDGTFPNYSAVIPPMTDKFFTINRKAFLASIDRVSVISDDKSKTVKLEVKDNKICISAINAMNGGIGKDEIIIEKNCDDNWDACFNARYLIDVSEAVSSEKLKIFFSSKLSSILILPSDDSSAKFVIMPMRI